MAPPPEWQKRRLTRLCDLVAASLLPHLEAETLPPRQLTREDERRLLLVLSKVNKAILGWSQEEEEEEQRRCESDQEIFSCSGEVHSCCLPPGQHPHDGFGCLANVVSILVGVLGFCSGYVKHSAGNVLVSISSTLIKFDSIWIQFIELVWAAIHAESKCVHNALHSTTDSNNEDITSSSTSITSFMIVLNERCLDISSLLQLLCSLLEQSYLEGTDGQDMYVKLVDIVPKIAASLQEQHDGSKSLYQYLKHKILMVMMRLKPYMQQDCSRIVCYLKLLRQYFHDLLHEPISQHIAKLDNCLEGSPFLLNMVDLVESQDKSTRHLQRQAIYLFLSFSICLSYNRNDGTLQCSCKRDDCLLGHKVQGCSDHCSCSGLSEISDWFQRCYLDMSFDSKSSTDIALSFLALYMEEDDMLFSILLQLFDAPHIFLKIDSINSTELIGAKLFSSIFDPVHLFHLLLLLLHYDHMVLVDYLISKDVGVHCAQYLLRCLRLVSQSWHAFVDDSMYLTKIEKIDCKRQRTSRDISSARASSSNEYKNGSGCDKEAKNSQKLFLDAKVCLYSLKRTVEDLQKKGLFPYNPKPLLRSLARFEELCEQG
ncbi:hypothetical protein SETIT_1G010300v2 [Setaria italica]|uniref:Protein Lines C-terminal domain-containing protein n=1 Tax=Setaria italica TaxID=4555 RepID=A0A368PFI0_SETIT|nr:uncharacterized protein LOC101753284 isoform X2 [Setaria italica]RCV04555.1 hypothetical protein SETIT_1G010300v2 [Setaria italica]RCV04556.1 hypothetical protein SETIT_1G010300v2 [Setaria italica]RCV04557.1 hypothetical protein SETIT_1G010300v2 [Setaria italica]